MWHCVCKLHVHKTICIWKEHRQTNRYTFNAWEWPPAGRWNGVRNRNKIEHIKKIKEGPCFDQRCSCAVSWGKHWLDPLHLVSRTGKNYINGVCLEDNYHHPQQTLHLSFNSSLKNRPSSDPYSLTVVILPWEQLRGTAHSYRFGNPLVLFICSNTIFYS